MNVNEVIAKLEQEHDRHLQDIEQVFIAAAEQLGREGISASRGYGRLELRIGDSHHCLSFEFIREFVIVKVFTTGEMNRQTIETIPLFDVNPAWINGRVTQFISYAKERAAAQKG